MGEVNRILNDESNNDKDLVRDLSVYIKNHKDKGLPINKKFVKDITDIILRNNEINFNDIVFTNDCCRLAAWYNKDNVLEINLTNTINGSKFLKEVCLKSKTGDNKMFAYYETIATLIHELTHAKQGYIMETNKESIYDPGEALVDEHYSSYIEHHDETLDERYANLREKVIAYQVMTYIYPSKFTNQFRNEIFYYLLYGYLINNVDEIINAPEAKVTYDDSEVISAIDNYNSILSQHSIEGVNIEATEDMTLYDRLYLGLPITLEEYEDIMLLWERLNTEDGDVKKLINKLQRN